MKQNNFGGIFSKLVEKANKATNSEKAKSIRKKLLTFGIIGVVISIILTFIGFFSFASAGMNMVDTFGGFPSGIIFSMAIFMIGGLGISISSLAIRAGLAIVVAGVAADFLDTNDYCPKCKDRVDDGEMFCNNCGHNLRANKLCTCGTQNDLNDNFCRTCGKHLA